MCQVHAGAYVSLLALGKTDYTACHPLGERRPRIDYIARSTYYYAYTVTSDASQLEKENHDKNDRK